MGTLINFHIELNIMDKWHHFNHPFIPSSKKLVNYLSKKDSKGFPLDATLITFLHRQQNLSTKDVRILNLQEFKDLINWLAERENIPDDLGHSQKAHWPESLFGYPFDNSWSAFNPKTDIPGCTDVRCIYWFY